LLKKVKKNIFISLGIAGILYLGFTIYANFNNVIFAFASFNWFLIPLLLLLSLTNYCIRFLKWDYYLKVVDVKIKTIDSFSIFMSGLIMSVTPGKMGELLKSYLVKEVTKTPISKTFPIVFAERITDFVSLIFIALLGAYVFNFGRGIVIGVGIFFLVVLILISNRSIAEPLVGLFEKSKFFRKHLESIHNAYESSYQLLRPLPMIYMTLLSLVSWSFECLGYHLILINFNIGVSFLWSSFSYGFAIIIGAISMLPGGLGVTEGSLTFMLVRNNFPKNIAVASTFIIRVATLWFAVLIGIISVTIYQNRFGKISMETVSN
jgi:uncharacterized protein (TIRG00374 family)